MLTPRRKRPGPFFLRPEGGADGAAGGGAGVLMVVPYFIPNVILMAVVSCAMTALPWFVREG